MNSIAAYLIAHLWEDFFINNLHVNLGDRIFHIFGTGLEPFVLGITVMLIYWWALYWMYQEETVLAHLTARRVSCPARPSVQRDLPCPILSVFFCRKGGKAKARPVFN